MIEVTYENNGHGHSLVAFFPREPGHGAEQHMTSIAQKINYLSQSRLISNVIIEEITDPERHQSKRKEWQVIFTLAPGIDMDNLQRAALAQQGIVMGDTGLNP